MSKVRWGILSTARIGTQYLIPALQRAGNAEIVAIASRDAGAAHAAAARFGIARAWGRYEELLADPAVEVIYNPLPNPMHVPWTLAAARAGKHVLCEKPMGMNAGELDALEPFASRVHLQEAYMVRHHPQWHAAREHLRRGEIGELRYLHVPFSYHNVDAANIRNRLDAGGGALLDIGGYVVTAGRWFFEEEPQRVVAAVDRDPAFGTDRLASGVLDFGGGRHLAFSVATQAAPYQRLQLVGTQGRIEVQIPFNAPVDAPLRYWVDDCSSLDGRGMREHVLPVADQYQLQVEAFSRRVREAAPDGAALAEARATMRVVDALFASERSGRFEPV